MAVTPDKRALREAAEKIERAVDAYGAGDLLGSTRLIEEALAIMPQHARAQLYLGWVRDLSSGKKKLGGVEDETLQSLSDLSLDEEQTLEKRAIEARPAAADESPWDPVPLTPNGQKVLRELVVRPLGPMETLPLAPRALGLASSPPPPPGPVAEGREKQPSSTLLGMSPDLALTLLTPARGKNSYESNESTGSMTREWKTTPTASNLPPLDVPELTDEQIHELLALDGSAMALEVAPQPVQPRVLETLNDLVGRAAPQGRFLVIEAEPEAEPHLLHPLGPTRVPLPAQDGDGARARGATTQDADLRMLPAIEFDALEQTPTRERLGQHEPGGEAPAGSEDDSQLPPLEAQSRDDILGDGTNPTNPFIKRRLAEYTHPTGQLPKVDDLPPAPGLGDTNRQPVVQTLQAIQDPLDRGDLPAAVQAAEKFLTDEGGLDADSVQPHVWLLERVYESILGPLQAVPRHGQAASDLDPRSAFLLSRLDGMSSLDDLLDVSGMPRLEALRVLALLVRRGVVTLT